MNEPQRSSLPWWLPFVIGAALVVQFAALGGWQISRGLEKREQQELFSDESGFTAWQGGMDVRSYQRLSVSGKPDSDHQFLLDNIIFNSRVGYYVLTPLDPGNGERLLMINRGWIEKSSDDFDATTMGEAVTPGQTWPQRAVYPTLEDLEAALGRGLQPFVLLMDPQDDLGFVRHWVPEEMGPGRHFAYALQWFAMATVLAALLVWNFRRQRARHG